MLIHRIWVVFLVVISISCQEKTVDGQAPEASDKGEILPTAVSVFLVERRAFEYRVMVPGRVEAQREVQMIARTSGMIKKVLVENGDRIHSGQVILALEDEDEKLELEKSYVMLREKQISYEDHKMGYEGLRDSFKRDQVLSNIRISSGLALAELTHKQAEQELEKRVLKSPIEGKVSALKVKQYNPIHEGDLVAIIYDPRELIVQCKVSELDATQFKKGDPAEVKSIGGESVFNGHVLNIDARVDDKTRLVDVIIALESGSHFFPGVSVQVVVKAPGSEALLIPKEAVSIKSGKAVVFTEEGGLAKWNDIVLGRENEKEVEVLSGLAANKKVIVSNNLQLVHDSPVQVIVN
jgi:membrane fusion protein, multidrug efflux system